MDYRTVQNQVSSDEESCDGAALSEPHIERGPTVRIMRMVALVASVALLAAVIAVTADRRFSSGRVKVVAMSSDRVVSYSEVGILNGTFESGGKATPISCSDGSKEFSSVSTSDDRVLRAIDKALGLADAERTKCDGGPLPPLSYEAAQFTQDIYDSHTVVAHHKFGVTCGSETFKLHFFVRGMESKDPHTSFVMQVAHDKFLDSWTMLASEPLPCQLRLGSASTPQVASPSSNASQKVAAFAAQELFYQMDRRACLPESAAGKSFRVNRVKNVVQQVTRALRITIRMDIEVGDSSDVREVLVNVLERCTEAQPCFYQLEESDVCGVFDSGANRRRLEEHSLGSLPMDPTELWEAKKRMLSSHGSTDRRQPLIERHIQEGQIPRTHDPRSDKCFQDITVYNQGVCGSCYAQAISQMIGIRKCVEDTSATNSRLLTALNNTKSLQNVVGLSECMDTPGFRDQRGYSCASWKHFHCREAVEHHFYTQASEDALLRSCPKSCQNCPPPAAARQPEGCVDSTAWRDRHHNSCADYASQDPGCQKYTDVGQRTHCRKTCGTCPGDFADNPWEGAEYQYMPAVNDVAACANSGGQRRGCEGGNLQAVWNNWMQNLDRNLWRMGNRCMPYTMKCFESKGVVNPLNSGSCHQYGDRELWHKPCSCIPQSERPASDKQCPRSAPRDSCSVPVPHSMYIVSGVAQGLSNAEAVKNYQRHLAEGGPIYVSFDVTKEFEEMASPKHVYTGGTEVMGGHAVLAVGWGRSGGHDYWILRNSWGADWMDNGYCLFKRGINLDGIENFAGASFPSADHRDYSAPVCALQGEHFKWSYRGSQLITYKMTLEIECNKPASLEVFVSKRLLHRSDIQQGVSGRKKEYTMVQKVNAGDFELTHLDFGLKTGDTWIDIKADDGKGNTAKFDHFVQVNKVPNMVSLG